MTKEELKTHCEKTVKSMTMWKNHPSDGGRFFFNPRVLEEHQLILDLINREEVVLKALEDIRAEIEAKERVELSINEQYFNFALTEVTEIIDRKIEEIKHDR